MAVRAASVNGTPILDIDDGRKGAIAPENSQLPHPRSNMSFRIRPWLALNVLRTQEESTAAKFRGFLLCTKHSTATTVGEIADIG